MSIKGILLGLLVLLLTMGMASAAFVQLDSDIRGGTITGVAITDSTIDGADLEAEVNVLQSLDNFAVTVPVPASPVDGVIFTAPWNCTVVSVKEAHTVAQNTAFPSTGSVYLRKWSSGGTAGSLLHNTTLYLNSTIMVPRTPTLNTTTNACRLTTGQMIVADYSGTVTTLAGMAFTIEFERV